MGKEWRHRIQLLKLYVDNYGHYPSLENDLGAWYHQQKDLCEKGLLSEDKCKILQSLAGKDGIDGKDGEDGDSSENGAALSIPTCDVDINIEHTMQTTIIEKFLRTHPDWILFAQEYTLIPFMCNMGKGDLVFMHKDTGKIHIIECKKHKPNKTQAQALYYAAWWKLQHPPKRVTYQSVTLHTYDIAQWSSIQDMDLQDAGFILLKKFTELQGLNDKEIKTMAGVFTNLYTK